MEKGGENMPINEKEYNGNLFDQLMLLERLEIEAQIDNAENVLKLIAFEKRQLTANYIKNNP